MQLLVADWPDGDSEQVRVVARVQEPSFSGLRALLFTIHPIDYGTHFILYGSAIGELTAISTRGPACGAEDADEFLLYLDGELQSEGRNRSETLTFLASSLRRTGTGAA